MKRLRVWFALISIGALSFKASSSGGQQSGIGWLHGCHGNYCTHERNTHPVAAEVLDAELSLQRCFTTCTLRPQHCRHQATRNRRRLGLIDLAQGLPHRSICSRHFSSE